MIQRLLSLIGLAPAVGGVKPSAKRSSRWPALRAAHLKAFPACAVCGQRENVTPHHIFSYHRFPDLELVPANLISLCEGPGSNCHLLFGHLCNWQTNNPAVVYDAAQWSKKIKERQ